MRHLAIAALSLAALVPSVARAATAGVEADEADFRRERAAIDNRGLPPPASRWPHLVIIKGTDQTGACRTEKLRDVTVADERGKPVRGLRLDGTDATTDAAGRVAVPKGQRLCNATISGQSWKVARLPIDAVHAKVTATPAAALLVDAHAGPRPCPKPALTSPAPDADDVWSPNPGQLAVRGLDPLTNRVTVECGLAGSPPQTVTVALDRHEDRRVEVEFPDPSLSDPANHFSVRGTLRADGPLAAARVRVHCADVVRTVTVADDGAFVADHLPESPRCSLVYGTSAHVGHAVVPSPSKDLALELK